MIYIDFGFFCSVETVMKEQNVSSIREDVLKLYHELSFTFFFLNKHTANNVHEVYACNLRLIG